MGYVDNRTSYIVGVGQFAALVSRTISVQVVKRRRGASDATRRSIKVRWSHLVFSPLGKQATLAVRAALWSAIQRPGGSQEFRHPFRADAWPSTECSLRRCLRVGWESEKSRRRVGIPQAGSVQKHSWAACSPEAWYGAPYHI